MRFALGMENTCLTFVTPVLIAHDRSLTDVCAHEIAYVPCRITH